MQFNKKQGKFLTETIQTLPNLDEQSNFILGAILISSATIF